MNKHQVIDITLLLFAGVTAFLEEYSTILVLFIGVMAAVVLKYEEWETASLIIIGAFIILFFSIRAGIIIVCLSRFVHAYKQHGLANVVKELFSHTVGVEADDLHFLYWSPTSHDLLKYGTKGDAQEVIIWAGKDIYKAIFDTENKKLYVREGIFAPIYSEKLLPLWGEIRRVHTDGSPEMIEFRDSTNTVSRVDYFDEKGNRTKRSWRRIRWHIEYWNSEKGEWERAPIVPPEA